MLILEKAKGRLKIYAQILYIGKDLIIVISGGDTFHIGSVTTFGKNDLEETKLFKNHRDDEISKEFAKDISGFIEGNCVVCVGIHLDNITKKEINDVRLLCKQISDELLTIVEERNKYSILE